MFIFLWALTLVVIGYPILRGLRRPSELTTLPFIASFFGAYFYLYMSYQASINLGGILPQRVLERAQLVVLAGFVALYLGWFTAPSAKKKAAGKSLSPKTMWQTGLAFLWAGAIADTAFRSSGVGFDTSAYWYMAYQVAYPASAMCVIALVGDRTLRSTLNYCLLLTPVLGIALPYLVAARRGPTLAWLLVATYSFALARRRPPSRAVIFGMLSLAGVLALIAVNARTDLANGDDFLTASRKLSVDKVVSERTRTVSDNEFAYHCAMVDTCLTTGRYQYGTGHALLFLSWIPRSLWQSKPGRGEGLLPPAKEVLEEVTGISMGAGMCAAGIADSFEQYGFAFVLYWFVLGRLGAKAYQRTHDSWFWQVTWVNVMACSHWLIAQGFAAFVVPMLLGEIVPVVTLLRARASRRGARPGTPRLVEAPAAPTSSLTRSN